MILSVIISLNENHNRVQLISFCAQKEKGLVYQTHCTAGVFISSCSSLHIEVLDMGYNKFVTLFLCWHYSQITASF